MDANHLLKALCFTTGLAASSLAMAIPQADVGGLDAFVSSTELPNSDPVTQEAYVDSVLAPLDATYIARIETPNDGADWSLVDGTDDLYALFLDDYLPDYFLVKTGDNKASPDREFLYQNLTELSYAVIDLSDVGIDNIGKISHVTLFGVDQVTEVPEPGSIGLLGLALAGLGAFRRRK